MTILALDLGTKCGWAALYDLSGGEISVESGVWNLQPSKFESAGQRFVKFKKALHTNSGLWKLVVYEEVRAHVAVDAAHIYGGLMAILQEFCIARGIEYKGVPVGTIKKYATGKGNAKKPDMILAANRLFPSINVLDDNHADALCLLAWATHNIIH